MALFNIPIRDIFAGSKSQEDPDRDAAGIPFTAKEHIRALKKEYEERTLAANDPGMESCFKYGILVQKVIDLTAQHLLYARMQLLLGVGPFAGQG